MSVVSHLEHVIKVCFVKKKQQNKWRIYCVYSLPFYHAILFTLCVSMCIWAPGGTKILQTNQTKIKLLFQAQLPPSQRLFLKRRYFYVRDAFELIYNFFRLINACVQYMVNGTAGKCYVRSKLYVLQVWTGASRFWADITRALILIKCLRARGVCLCEQVQHSLLHGCSGTSTSTYIRIYSRAWPFENKNLIYYFPVIRAEAFTRTT